MKCLRPGCDRPAKSNGNGRHAEFCSAACRNMVHRLWKRLLKRRGLTMLFADVQRAVAAWEGCHTPNFKTHFYEFAAIMDVIAAHPLVGSRAVPSRRSVVPSPQPLPGATPIFRSAGQGAALAAFQDWPEDD